MIRPITAARTRPLRQAVLRPQQAAEELVYPGDDAPETLHLGAFVDGRLVGIASIYCEAMPDTIYCEAMPDSASFDAMPDAAGAGNLRVVGDGTGLGARELAPDRSWRLRGMATLPEARGTGLGGALLDACIDHIARNGGTRLWCNARTTAAGFYVRYRFTVHGEAFDLPGIGPHYLMSRAIVPSAKD